MKQLLVIFTLLSSLCLSLQICAKQIHLYTYFQNNAAPRYMLSNDIPTGIGVDILAQLNILLKPHEISIININNDSVPITRILHSLEKNEKIDLFVGGAKTKARMLLGVQFSIPIYPLFGTFAKHKQNPFIYNNKDSLKEMTVGVLRGSRSVQTMSKFEGVKIEKTNTMQQSLKKLASGRIDLVYYHAMGLAWQIKKSNLKEQLTLIDKHENIESAPHYILFSSRTSPDIIALINNLIKTMHNDGSIGHILNKYR